jgi:hypothetical protein
MIVDPPQQGRNACGGAANLIESHHAPAIVYCASGRLLLRAATGNRGSARLQRLVALRLNRKPTFCPKCLPLTLVARAEPDELTTVRYPPQAAVADAGGMQKTTVLCRPRAGSKIGYLTGDAESNFRFRCYRTPGHAAAALVTAHKIGLDRILGLDGNRCRDLVLALLVGRIFDPTSKLAAARAP